MRPVTDTAELAALRPVDLATVVDAASLWRRVDRKYVVPADELPGLLSAVSGTHHVLEIDGRRATSYRSAYLDTDDLRLCRDHLQGRRRRWKARSRLYVEDALCRFEVKVKGDRGETVKHALELSVGAYGRFEEPQRTFLLDVLPSLEDARVDLDGLHPVLEVGYLRSTLVDLAAGVRVTIDQHLGAHAMPGGPLEPGVVRLDPGRVVVETKGGSRPGAVDLLLRRAGHRPVTLSKYVAGASLLADHLPLQAARPLMARGFRRCDEERRAS